MVLLLTRILASALLDNGQELVSSLATIEATGKNREALFISDCTVCGFVVVDIHSFLICVIFAQVSVRWSGDIVGLALCILKAGLSLD